MRPRETRVARRAWALLPALVVFVAMGPVMASCGGVGDVGARMDAAAQDDAPSLGTDTPGCAPASCQALGYTCGKNADGCGALVDCGTCGGADYCGGGGFSRCGTGGAASAGDAGGPGGPGGPGASGGAGGAGTAGGAGGAPRDGGGAPGCVPSTCSSLGVSCGAAGDGCGNLLQCGSCSGPDTCGGGTKPGVCGHDCTGLCTQQVACTGAPTTITGRVLAGVSSWVPAGTTPDPVPGALVYVPNGALAPFAAGAQCTTCGADVSGDPLVSTTTAFDGTFSLANVPVGTHIPVVVQLGRWRREVYFDVTASCATTAVGDLHLPRNRSEGDIPLTAISTGAVDSLECILLKMGVDEGEFSGTGSGGSGRIHLYSAGLSAADANGHGPGASAVDSEPESALLGSGGSFMSYDQIMLPCWGDEFLKSSDQLASLVTYANGGGRFFATHFSYTWLFQNPPFDGTAAWDVNADRNSTANGGVGVPFTGNIDVSRNPQGNLFAKWLGAVGALSSASPAQVTIEAGRHDVDAVRGSSVDWIDGTDPSPPAPAQSSMLLHYTFDTPVGQAATCGHAIFSDFHVNDQGSTSGMIFPGECDVAALTPQERILEYMIWNLQSCTPAPLPGPPCTPRSCADQGLACGPTGDGCGNVIQCGTCAAPQTCGGGGTRGVCGGPPPGTTCTPATCASLGVACGPASDRCGGQLDCGSCAAPLTCGGGGVPGQCGAADAGVRCAPQTCAAQGLQCGPAGDGCGGVLDCGGCPSGTWCGSGGFGKCGSPVQ